MNPKVVSLPRPRLLQPVGGNSEQPKDFRFAVSWEMLLAQPVLALPQPAAVKSPAAPSHALQVVEPPRRPPQGDEAAWEMVVPKMVRK
ncbi:MAG: hypothetical protein ABSH31_17040 [Bryobacteraceae bacterium]